MNTDHLKYLVAISKTKSMSQASESLFVSPQALSMAIKKLEDELSMPLLTRSSSGTKLTENGQWLVNLSAQFFEDIALRQEQYEAHLAGGHLKPSGVFAILHSPSGVGDSQLASIICDINKQKSNFTINLTETTRQEVAQSVLDNTIEMGFIHRTKYNKRYIDDLDDSLSFHPLQKGSLLILAHPSYPFAKFESTYLKTIVDYPICGFEPAYEARLIELLSIVTNKNIHYTPFNNYSLYRANIIQGNSIALTVKFDSSPTALNHIEDVSMIKVRDDIQVHFGVLRKKDAMTSINASYFWQKILKSYPKI